MSRVLVENVDQLSTLVQGLNINLIKVEYKGEIEKLRRVDIYCSEGLHIKTSSWIRFSQTDPIYLIIDDDILDSLIFVKEGHTPESPLFTANPLKLYTEEYNKNRKDILCLEKKRPPIIRLNLLHTDTYVAEDDQGNLMIGTLASTLNAISNKYEIVFLFKNTRLKVPKELLQIDL